MKSKKWERMDKKGEDTCYFNKIGDKWEIKGNAIYFDKQGTTNLLYKIICDRKWRSIESFVEGKIAGNDFNLSIKKDQDTIWRVNGRIEEHLTGFQDIDLGFTPASNTNAINRLSLKVGDKAETWAIWLDTSDWEVKPLKQIYKRIGDFKYEYESPLHNYKEIIVVDNFGVIIEYPKLWTAIQN